MSATSITNVTPFLTVKNGVQAVQFYISAFDAVEVRRFELADSKISSVIEVEGARFYVGDEEIENGNVSPDMDAASSVRIVLQTKNADRLYEQAVRSGATVICPMTTEEDWRIGKIRDPFGHVWEIGYTL
ncbi:MAG: VOC family protein [Chitinophagaceae bacterium]|nr:MAG: VOC family protein [Chitinophagaceae bacterium]